MSAARDLARSQSVKGSARLEIVLDSSGRVLRAAVVDNSEDTEGWERIAEALQDTPLRVMRGEGNHGVWMLVDVSSSVQLISGRTQWWAPGVTLVFDVADISARSMRVVHANVASQMTF